MAKLQGIRSALVALAMAAHAASVNAEDLAPARQSAVDQFSDSEREPTAIMGLWTMDSVFKVGVLDDGSDRSGYAEYVCMALYDHGLGGNNILVRVIDAPALIDRGEFINLGTAHCH